MGEFVKIRDILVIEYSIDFLPWNLSFNSSIVSLLLWNWPNWTHIMPIQRVYM